MQTRDSGSEAKKKNKKPLLGEHDECLEQREKPVFKKQKSQEIYRGDPLQGEDRTKTEASRERGN